MTEAHQPDNTPILPGVYVNGMLVVAQDDGMFRLLFKDGVGGAPVDRAHLVLTPANALELATMILTLAQPSGPASAAN